MIDSKLSSIIKDYLLYEGLLHSENIDSSVEYINRWASASDKLRAKSSVNNKIVIKFYKNLTSEEVDNLYKLINNIGWFISTYLPNILPYKHKKFDIKNFKNDMEHTKIWNITLESKFGEEINKYDLTALYHISDTSHETKISKIGLVPKSLNKITYHPERIYFVSDKNDISTLIDKFKYKTPIIYNININGLISHNNSIRFFKDPNLIGGIFTLSNIPPKFLRVIAVKNISI